MVVVGGGGANQLSCQTQFLLNCVRLFGGCFIIEAVVMLSLLLSSVVLWLSCGFDKI